jgi:LmbE family N-acetylglucosaminyl deacetylase
MASNAFAPLNPTSVLCVAAHADDIEAFMGGTVARYAASGTAVHYLILTDGARGGNDPAEDTVAQVRQTEQQTAAGLLGVTSVTFGQFPDCELALTPEVKREIVRAIRKTKPQVVICLDPAMVYSLEWGMINHIDHRITGEAVLTAVYPLACNAASYPELTGEGLQPHKVDTVLLANCDQENFVIDITEHMDQKLSALRAHTSQLTYLEEVFKLVQTTAERHGSRAGARYAEAFIRIDLRI